MIMNGQKFVSDLAWKMRRIIEKKNVDPAEKGTRKRERKMKKKEDMYTSIYLSFVADVNSPKIHGLKSCFA